MGNARNGRDSSSVPQGLVGPVMPLPFEVSGNPIDIQQSVTISTLASALASASPETRNEVCNNTLSYFSDMHILQVSEASV